MKKGVSRMNDYRLFPLSMVREQLAQCRKGDVCYETECDIACMAWCDFFKVEPEQLREAISLLDDKKC